MIDTLKGKTKSYSKTFPVNSNVSDLMHWTSDQIGAARGESVLTARVHIPKWKTTEKYVITVTKIIPDTTDDALSQ